MSVQSIALERQTIIDQARSWLGVRFRHQGRSRERGVDCIGLIWCVACELKVDAPNIPANYSTSPSGALVLAGCEKHLWKPEDQRNARPGQVAILWGFDRETPQHFAFIGEIHGRPTMIHSFSRRMAVVEDGYDLFWAKRLVALYELPGTEPWSATP